MTTRAYTFQVLLTGFDASRAREVKEALGRVMAGPGNVRLTALLRQVADGAKVTVYESNSRQDAQDVAGGLARSGAEVEISR